MCYENVDYEDKAKAKTKPVKAEIWHTFQLKPLHFCILFYWCSTLHIKPLIAANTVANLLLPFQQDILSS